MCTDRAVEQPAHTPGVLNEGISSARSATSRVDLDLVGAAHLAAPFLGFLTILIKNSSIVSAIGVAELFYRGNTLANDNYKHFEIFTAIGAIYFVMIFPLSLCSSYLQRLLAPTGR